jgi:cytochrome d ubiquinol oxidase subunit II
MWPMWIESIAFFLGVSILFYCVFAGADFGAGILELFLAKKQRQSQRELITHAMGPVWEANHVWIILAVVILFNGFPQAYSQLSITFHLPLTLMLFGIIARGCAFTFRHYDAVRDRAHRYYSVVFALSSVLTPFALGLIAGGVTLGRVDLHAQTYFAGYIAPWCNLFCLAMGMFTCALFAFLAAIYLFGETRDPALHRLFRRRAQITIFGSIITGFAVFASAEAEGLHLAQQFFADPWAIAAMGLATALFGPLHFSIHKKQFTLARFEVAVQVSLVLFGWFKLQYPVLILTQMPAEAITVYTAAAPDSSLRYLLYALLGGSALIFPALFYLLRIFKIGNANTAA